MPINKQILGKYKNHTFIETGSFLGDGIQTAIDCDFDLIYSIEIAEHLYCGCLRRFENDNRVNLILGDSSVKLEEVLNQRWLTGFNKTIFLDGHFSGGITSRGQKNSPLIDELEIIKKYYVKGDIILIDDIRLATKLENPDYDFECSVDEIKSKLLEIDRDFELSYEDSYQGSRLLFPKDILVARSKSNG